MITSGITVNVDAAHQATELPDQGAPSRMTSLAASSIPTTNQQPMVSLSDAEAAEKSGNIPSAIQLYNSIIGAPGKDADALKDKETAILRVGSLLSKYPQFCLCRL